MNITDFADLLQASRLQPEPQRLLFVFVAATLPDDATPAERERFERAGGGALQPVLCVDKLPAELEGFATLVEESARTGIAWDLVFAAGMAGRAGFAPGPDEAEQPLKMMVGAIESGSVGQFLAFDRQGQTVAFY